MNSYYLYTTLITFLSSLILAWFVCMKLDNFKGKLFTSKPERENILLVLAVSIYFLVFSGLAIAKYRGYNLGMIDLGRMDQVIWNTLHGRFFMCTLEFGNVCRMIAHIELVYILVAPLYLIFSSPQTLLILQTLIISLGAFPIYWLSRERLGGGFTPLCFALAYLLYPSLQYGNLVDFHPDMLATTFLLFTFYHLERGNWLKYFIFLLLSLMCKEYISFIALMFGVYIFNSKKNIKFSGLTVLLSIFWFLLAYKIIPIYLGGKENKMVEYYSSIGTSTGLIFKNIVLHPVAIFLKFITFNKIANLVLLLLPLGFISLLSMPVLVIASPVFIGLILSPFFSYTNHHNGVLIPFIFISAIYGAQYLSNKLKFKHRGINYVLGIFIFSSSLFAAVFYGPSPLSWRFWDKTSYRYCLNLQQFRITEHDKIADKIVKLVPPKSSLSASNHLGAHLSQRETIYHFPEPRDFSQIDCILVDLLEYFPIPGAPREDEIAALRKILLDNKFYLKKSEDGFLFFKKGRADNINNYFVNVSVVKETGPLFPIGLTFNRRLKLIGYNLKDNYLKAGKQQRIIYYWQVLEDFNKEFSYTYFGSKEKLKTEYILSDTIEKNEVSFRLVHLPLYIIYPPQDWRAGDIIKEEFDFYVPENIPAGVYKWKIGLYVAPEGFFIETEKKNLIPETTWMKMGEIKIKKELF